MRLIALLAFALPALAQDYEVQRALIQRDQQSAEFALRLRQSQEGAPAPDDLRHLNELQRLQNSGELQLQQVQKDLAPELRPYERQKAASEHVLRLPPPVVRVKAPEPPKPLPAKLPPAVDVVGEEPAGR